MSSSRWFRCTWLGALLLVGVVGAGRGGAAPELPWSALPAEASSTAVEPAVEAGVDGVEGSPTFVLPTGVTVQVESAHELGLMWEGRALGRLRVRVLLRGERDGLGSEWMDASPVEGMGGEGGPPLPGRPVEVAGLEVQGRAERVADGRLRSEWYHWPYFQVDDLVVWNLRFDGGEPAGLEVEWVMAEGWGNGRQEPTSTIEEVELKPHGRAAASGGRRRWPHLRVEDDRGRRVVLGLLTLEHAASAEMESGEDGRLIMRLPVAQPGRASWLLALVTGRSEASLRYNGGQALRMVPREAGDLQIESKSIDRSSHRLELPPLCYNCRSASIAGSRLRLSWRPPDEYELWVEIEGLRGHGALDGEALEWEGFPLARWWEGGDRLRAFYRLPLGTELIPALLAAAASGQPLVLQLPLDTGVMLDSQPRLEIDPRLQSKSVDMNPKNETPRKLAPELLEAWPNPFRERTSIRVRIPVTVGEAFFFPEGAPAGVDLSAPPPFGSAPPLRISVYNVTGKLVRTLIRRASAQGTVQVEWDGKDWMGRPVVAGAYYLDVEIGDEHLTRRILRLRS